MKHCVVALFLLGSPTSSYPSHPNWEINLERIDCCLPAAHGRVNRRQIDAMLCGEVQQTVENAMTKALDPISLALVWRPSSSVVNM